jgi:hypothetical protein
MNHTECALQRIKFWSYDHLETPILSGSHVKLCLRWQKYMCKRQCPDKTRSGDGAEKRPTCPIRHAHDPTGGSASEYIFSLMDMSPHDRCLLNPGVRLLTPGNRPPYSESKLTGDDSPAFEVKLRSSGPATPQTESRNFYNSGKWRQVSGI